MMFIRFFCFRFKRCFSTILRRFIRLSEQSNVHKLILILLPLLITLWLLLAGLYLSILWDEMRRTPPNRGVSIDQQAKHPENQVIFAQGAYVRNWNVQSRIPSLVERVKNPKRTRYVPDYRAVHLDLKGAPPKVSYFSRLFPRLKRWGANMLLVEWEDMFPYEGIIGNVKALNHYSREDVSLILESAKKNDLEVIPLVQTFGHLEFALKLEEYKELRETPSVPQSLCPSNVRSLELVKEMIRQIMAVHKDSRWIHIGCDEVFNLGQCDRCFSRVVSNFTNDKRLLFVDHVKKVANYVKENYQIGVIIWDDMLRQFSSRYELSSSGFEPDLVEVMVWVYAEDIYRFVPQFTWSVYTDYFKHLWTAGAYKGAFGETEIKVNVHRQVDNTAEWLDLMEEVNSLGTSSKFRGMVLTGWQRYDHFAVLCELLPSSVPSLALGLATLKEGRFTRSVIERVADLLECENVNQNSFVNDVVTLINNPSMSYIKGRCFFPGHEVFAAIYETVATKYEIDAYVDNIRTKSGWMSDYNVKHGYSSPSRVEELTNRIPFLQNSCESLKKLLRNHMQSVYDNHTINEFIEQHVDPLETKLNDLYKDKNELSKRNVWPRRPLPANNIF
ncbi:hex-4 (predicted) [Pycnogonum litorale]